MKHAKLPYYIDETRNEGMHGSGLDVSSGYYSYALCDADGKIIADTLNSDLTEVSQEYDEDGRYAWDSVGENNLKFIARAANNHTRLVDSLRRLIDISSQIEIPVALGQRYAFNGWLDEAKKLLEEINA